jgi:hypothetical protein
VPALQWTRVRFPLGIEYWAGASWERRVSTNRQSHENRVISAQSTPTFRSHPHPSANCRNVYKACFQRGLAPAAAPSPITKPQPFSVGVFSRPIAPVPACSRGSLRKPADFGIWPMAPSRATFLSLPAVFLSGLALLDAPEVRKGREAGADNSRSYARTNQAVELQLWKGNETGRH